MKQREKRWAKLTREEFYALLDRLEATEELIAAIDLLFESEAHGRVVAALEKLRA